MKSEYARESASSRWPLYSEPEVYLVRFVAGVAEVVVRSTAIELVALPNLMADDDAKGDRAETRRDPSHGFEQRRFFLLKREWKVHGIDLSAEDAAADKGENHGKDDSAA